MLRFLFAALLFSTAAAATSELVGPESCRSCHQAAYEAWSKSAHARAHQSLTAEQRKQPLCLACHSRDEQRSGQAQVAGVSCETCHGAGRSYQAAVVMRDKELARMLGLQDVTAQSCLACHNGDSPSLKAFDANEAMAKIDHWTAERASRGVKKASLPVKSPKSPLASWIRDGDQAAHGAARRRVPPQGGEAQTALPAEGNRQVPSKTSWLR
jgi:hypothetical protein